MNRREFITFLSVAAAAWPLRVEQGKRQFPIFCFQSLALGSSTRSAILDGSRIRGLNLVTDRVLCLAAARPIGINSLEFDRQAMLPLSGGGYTDQVVSLFLRQC
jgi:hypothetical protein